MVYHSYLCVMSLGIIQKIRTGSREKAERADCKVRAILEL